jgi:regulator of RNase E activity RraA
LIAPGDVLVGDPEGVIAIPQAVAVQAAEAGEQVKALAQKALDEAGDV